MTFHQLCYQSYFTKMMEDLAYISNSDKQFTAFRIYFCIGRRTNYLTNATCCMLISLHIHLWEHLLMDFVHLMLWIAILLADSHGYFMDGLNSRWKLSLNKFIGKIGHS